MLDHRPVALLIAALLLGCGGEDPQTDPTDTGTDSTEPDTEAMDTAAELDGEDVEPDTAPDAVDDSDVNDDTAVDVAPDVEEPRDDERSAPGEHPTSLPFDYEREPAGEPLTAEELTSFTDRFLGALETVGYFDYVDDRVHGWPANDPEGAYWYGTWWSGVSVERVDGEVIFTHAADGADNNGLRSAQLLEGACYALAMGDEAREPLVHELIRGFNSWVLAMESEGHPEWGVLMTRASYPESITTTQRGTPFTIDYSLNRPGEDNGATEYVHISDNPYWGDVWIKNKRSKDDMGHVFRAIAQLDACADALSPEASAELDRLYALYFAWARRVEDDDNGIQTIDAEGNLYIPSEDLAHYLDIANIECPGRLMMRLAGRGYTGGVVCDTGATRIDRGAAETRNGLAQIYRTHHEAAVGQAFLANRVDIAEPLVHGLAERIDWFIDGFVAGEPEEEVNPGDYLQLIIHAQNVGVPLTAQEVRWIHGRYEMAFASLAGYPPETWRLFAEDTPDGAYPYEPGISGLAINDFAIILGSCAAPWRNPAGEPLLDCERVREAFSAE